MNRTEHDVRRALDLPPRPDTVDRLTQLIQDLAETADRPALRTRPRQVLAQLLIAAAVIAVAATAALVVSDGRPHHGPAGSTGIDSPIATPVQLRPVWLVHNATTPGFTITRDDDIRLGLDANVEQGGLIRAVAPGKAGGSFTVEPATQGGYAGFVAHSAGGSQVAVDGRAGYFVPGAHIEPGRLNPAIYAHPWVAAANSSEDQPTLAVQHADGRWLLINGTFGFNPATYNYDNGAALTVMKKIDAALQVGIPHPVTVPFRLTSLPNGVTPEAASLLGGVPCLGYGTGAGPYPGEYAGSVMTVCRVETGIDEQHTLRPTRIDKTQVGALVIRPLRDGTSLVVEVDGGHLNEISRSDAQRLADRANVTPTLAESSTWLPVG